MPTRRRTCIGKRDENLLLVLVLKLRLKKSQKDVVSKHVSKGARQAATPSCFYQVPTARHTCPRVPDKRQLLEQRTRRGKKE
jgi:hypothetical protein